MSEPLPVDKVVAMITPDMDVFKSVVITPDIALALLTYNTANRPISKPNLERKTSDMSNGKWIFAGNMLKFSWDMVMRDGQHSLLAVIDSGTTQVFNIQTGLDPASFAVMDIGTVRSGGDVIAIKGYKNHYVLAAAIKTIIFYETHDRIKSNISGNKVSNKDVDRWSDKKPEMKILVYMSEQINAFIQKKKGTFLSGSTWLFVTYILSKCDKEAADEFIHRLAGGEDISMTKRTPIYLLREKLIGFGADHIGVLRVGGSSVTELKIRYIFRAWNAWRSKEKITKLVVKLKEEKVEKPI